MSRIFVKFNPGVSPPLGVEKWSRRYVIKMSDVWDFFTACGGVYGSGYQLLLNFAQTSVSELLFNPHSSFGRAVLKLTLRSRVELIMTLIDHGSLFKVKVIQRRAWPLLKAKRKKQLPIVSPTQIKFFPPLYLSPSPPPPQLFPPPIPLSTSHNPSYHFLNFVRLSFHPPRQGIG